MYGLQVISRKYIYHSRLLPRQQLKRHADESYIRNDEEAGYYTFLMNLNDNYSGVKLFLIR
jgi:prolyl 4-hydroxylase